MASSTTYISKRIESLLSCQRARSQIFDVIIIGSGYGGAVAAYELSQQTHPDGTPLKIALFERGLEYLPGEFPHSPADIPRKIRMSPPGLNPIAGEAEGLFDLRFGEDVHCVLANGLGGGSLINAGVMEKPLANVFEGAGWPTGLTLPVLTPYLDKAKQLLGATNTTTHQDNTILNADIGDTLPKYRDVREHIAGDKANFRNAAITIAMQDKKTIAGVSLNHCIHCGDCASGCNNNSKESLDTNLLAFAHKRGVEIYTGVTVLTIEQNDEDDIWTLSARYTNDDLHKREGAPFEFKTRKLILSAGSLGSTEILMRSQKQGFITPSDKLGAKFSSNGDMIAAQYNKKYPVNAIASSEIIKQRKIGPTITAIADFRESYGLLIEDLAIPHTLAAFFTEAVTTYDSVRRLTQFKLKRNNTANEDAYSVSKKKMAHTAVYALMSDDGANGHCHFDLNHMSQYQDGHLSIRWPELRDNPVFENQINFLKQARDGEKNTIPNFLWKPFPDGLALIDDVNKNALLTVHPLGGCAMADNAQHGVVNQWGQVFNAATGGVYRGLVVLDGAIIPSALGTNPALTISAVCMRAVEHLIAIWDYKQSIVTDARVSPTNEMVTQRKAQLPEYKPPQATTIKLLERLVSDIEQPIYINNQPMLIEIVAYYREKKLVDLVDHPASANASDSNTLTIDEDKSTMRIFSQQAYRKLLEADKTNDPEALDSCALFKSPLSGTLTLFEKQKTLLVQRIWSALSAWYKNRGKRDIAQAFRRKRHHVQRRMSFRPQNTALVMHPVDWSHIAQRLKKTVRLLPKITYAVIQILKIASHAGERRTLRYQFKTHSNALKRSNDPAHSISSLQDIENIHFRGEKLITYEHGRGLWEQISQLQLMDFPNDTCEKPFLHLDKNFFLEKNTPLFQIAQHENLVTTLKDLNTFLSYIKRMAINVHLWHMQNPDAPGKRGKHQLPPICSIPTDFKPRRLLIKDYTHDEDNSAILLTRYKPQRAGKPILLIHGYSASSTTYVHKYLKSGLAESLAQRGRDVWLLDLRTSSRLSTDQHNWTFEDIAFTDIPIALHEIYQIAKQKIDIVAHCLGAAMLSMTVLAHPKDYLDYPLHALVSDCKGYINKVVMSQGGPFITLSSENRMKAYLASYFKNYLGQFNLSFIKSDNQSVIHTVIDRMANFLPKHRENFDDEQEPSMNKGTAFVGVANRMNLFYNETFLLKNMDNSVIHNLPEFFKGVNAQILTQVMHFGLHNQLTNPQGKRIYTRPSNLQYFSNIPILHIHGARNGVLDPATAYRAREHFKDIAPFEYKVYPDVGHQDCIMGKSRITAPVFKDIMEFLSND